MATQAIPGYEAQVYISSDGGVTYRKLGELREVTLTVESEPIEVTSHDSGGWREYIAGINQWTASAEALYVAADAGQDAVYNALVNRQRLRFRFRPKEGAGNDQFEGEGFITSWELAGPLDDAAAVSIEIQGTGPLTLAVQ